MSTASASRGSRSLARSSRIGADVPGHQCADQAVRRGTRVRIRGGLTRPGASVGTATIAYAETYSGLTRRHRDGDLSAIDYASACEQFERDWSGYVRIRLDEDVLAAARLVIQRHALRGFDGIHLASALTLQNRWDETVVVVAADQRLLRAASTEGLATLDVETGVARRRGRRR